jgi:hypothetical protein
VRLQELKALDKSISLELNRRLPTKGRLVLD